mgnify:CR=1 FL=1
MSASSSGRTVLSLFTGAGGLDLGLEAAGFEPVLCVEVDEDAKATLKKNRPGWRLAEPGDIHALEPDEILRQAGIKPRELRLLAGGPPCQPFSKSAYWSNGSGRRLQDPRARTLREFDLRRRLFRWTRRVASFSPASCSLDGRHVQRHGIHADAEQQ